jgi:hypothetical protein
VALPLSAADSLAYQAIIAEHTGTGEDSTKGKAKPARRDMQLKMNLYQAGELLGKLRQFCSLSKVDGTAQLIRSHFATADDLPPGPVVVFVWFKDTAAKLIDQLSNSLQLEESNAAIDLTSDDSFEIKAVEQPRALVCESLTGDIIQQTVCGRSFRVCRNSVICLYMLLCRLGSK